MGMTAAGLGRWSVAAVLAAAVAGCAGRPPSFKVDDVRVTRATAEAAELEIALQARNAGREPIELREFEYRVTVGGGGSFSGRRAGGATLVPEQTRRLTLPAVIRNPAVLKRIEAGETLECRVSGSVLYLPTGDLAQALFDAGLLRPRASVGGRAATVR